MFRYLRNIDKGNFVTILLILFLSAGFLVLNDLVSSFSTILLWVLVMLYLLKGFKGINHAILVPSLTLLALYVLSSLVNGDSEYTVVACSFGFVVAFVYASSRSFMSFQTSYIEVMKVLCIISIVGFLGLSLLPFIGQLLSPFMSSTSGGRAFYNFYLFIYKPFSFRNSGMFWEPGAFQIFINIALLFEILKPKPSVINIAIFILTIITTFSTTGYIAVFLIFVLILFSRSNELRKTRKIFMWFVPVLLVLLIYNEAYLNDTSSYSTFGKLNSFVEDEEWKGGGEETSSSIRFFSVIKTMEAFFSSPLIGVGTRGLEAHNLAYTHGMNTCTFANWFGKYGIVYGFIMLMGFVRLSSLLGKNKGGLVKFLIFIFFFTITASEALSESPLLFMLCLYGYNDKQIIPYLNYNNRALVQKRLRN